MDVGDSLMCAGYNNVTLELRMTGDKLSEDFKPEAQDAIMNESDDNGF